MASCCKIGQEESRAGGFELDQFLDNHGCTVRLAFSQFAFDQVSQHVIVICRYQDKWLLTSHKQRGWEFPGGKIEPGETAVQAAKREVFEETGGMLETIFPLGEYEVESESNRFVKTIFYSTVTKLMKKNNYLETDGPVFEAGDILETRFQEKYSFIMKDDVMAKSLAYIDQFGLSGNSNTRKDLADLKR